MKKQWIVFICLILGLTTHGSSVARAIGNQTSETLSKPHLVLLRQYVDWSAPNYQGQEGSLGYRLGVFSVPPHFESRVSFWIDIYTKYSSNEGVLHDSQFPHIIYESLSFEDINLRRDIRERQKRKLRKSRIDEAKKNIIARLNRLDRLSSPVGLHGDDLRYWYLFSEVKGDRKLRDATHRKRLRFQLGQSDIFKRGIAQSGRYLPEMEKIFKAHNLPLELTRIPFVESSFNYRARSKVGASGIWQFMRYTGRQYLRMNRTVDERNEPIEATKAAAKLIRSNYKVLKDWPLAVTAYNHGAAGVRRKLKKFGVTNLFELVEKRYGRFGFASANFYSSFLAALEVEKNANHYFGTIQREQPLRLKRIDLKKSIHATRLLSWFDGNKSQAKDYNPHLKRSFWRGWDVIGRKDFINVPDHTFQVAQRQIQELKTSDHPTNLPNGLYKVGAGETLGGIARRLGIRLKKLMAVNGIFRSNRIQIGQKLIIPSNR